MRLPTFLTMLGLALTCALSLPAQTVRVIFVAGQASVQRPDERAPRPAVKGDTVIVGTRITTGPDGRVVLTPMPGVNSIVAPNTTLVLESASETRTSPTNVTHAATIDLKEGAVTTDLNKPEGVTYDYNIRTVRGLAGARGTTYTVGVNSAGIQTVVVAHGTIALTFADGGKASLTAGKLSITKPSGETITVGNISELSPEDQKIAQNWVDVTLAALATALEAGIELDPTALQNALDAAQSLGITPSPATQELLDRMLIQATLDRVEAHRDFYEPITNPVSETTTEVVTETATGAGGFPDVESFRASLNATQQAALDDILNIGGFNDSVSTPAAVAPRLIERPTKSARAELNAKLADPAFVKDLLAFVDYYAALPTYEGYSPERYLLTNLGILGNGNLAVFGADLAGLQNLLDAYAYLDAPSPYFLYEGNYAKDRPEGTTEYGQNFFFPGTYNNSGKTIYNVSFDTDGGSVLRIGATRKLIIDNTGYEGDTFSAGYSYGDPPISYGRVELRAIDLVSLNNTRFGPNVTSVLIEAATINLANISFRQGMSVELNSKLGEMNFGSSKFGYVNFLSNVSYGGTVLTKDNFYNVTDGYIQIGKIGQPRNQD